MTPSPSWGAITRGDREALEGLFAEWMPITLQRCRRLGGPRIDAEQAAQEIFLVVLRRVHTVRVREAFPPWLFEVTRRVLSQHRRRAWGRRWDPGADVDHFPQGVSGERAGERAEITRKVWLILDGMPNPLREVLVLCDVEQWTDVEAARLMSVPVGTAKSRLRRARALFRTRAEAAGLSPEQAR